MLAGPGLLICELDYHLLLAPMIIILIWFGYDICFEVEIIDLLPLINSGPFTSWAIPVLGVRGTSYFLGASGWIFALLLFLGFWNKKTGVFRCARILRNFCEHFDDAAFCSRCLAFRRKWFSSDDYRFGLSAERSCFARRICISVEAGCIARSEFSRRV